MLLRRELQINTINSKFEHFESVLYMKSVSMPLSSIDSSDTLVGAKDCVFKGQF